MAYWRVSAPTTGRVEIPGAAGLCRCVQYRSAASVTAIHFLRHRLAGQQLKRVAHVFQQFALVLLDPQNVVGLFADNFVGDRLLAADGVDGDYAAL